MDFSLNNNLIHKDNLNDISKFIYDGLNIIFKKEKLNNKNKYYNFNLDEIQQVMDKCVDMIASDFLAK